MKKREKIFLFLAILIFLAGTFLRFYRLEEFAIFLADQGRDAIIIKRIITLEHLPAIGPPSSVGQVYLGPFYYYFIAPWLWLFRFNPVGLAFGVAFFSSLFILISYFVIKKLLNEKVALIFSFFISFSSVLIEFSRFSWNPNLLPLFTFLTIYFLIEALQTQKKIFYLLLGSFLSFSIQLHYLALFLIPATGIILFPQFLKILKTKKIKEKRIMLLNYFIFLISFLFFSSPLFIFELRHNFLNSKNFLTLLKDSNNIASNKFTSLLTTFEVLNQYVFHFKVSKVFSIVLLTLFILSCLFLFKKNKILKIFFIFFLFSMIAISVYSGKKHPHYLLTLYPLYFVLLSAIFEILFSNFFTRIIFVLFFIAFIFLNSSHYIFINQKGNNQIQKAKKISKIIKDNSSSKFRLTALPETYSDTPYRYFLEIWRKKPIERESFEKTEELFVICEEKCNPIGNPQWDIAYFAPKKILNYWKIENIKVYKLVR